MSTTLPINDATMSARCSAVGEGSRVVAMDSEYWRGRLTCELMAVGAWPPPGRGSTPSARSRLCALVGVSTVATLPGNRLQGVGGGRHCIQVVSYFLLVFFWFVSRMVVSALRTQSTHILLESSSQEEKDYLCYLKWLHT